MARVLVVEDDVQTAAEIAAALGDSGFDVDCAHTGREGLLKAGADTYEAIVLDRMLPGGVDGLTVLSTLRKRRCLSLAPCLRWTSGCEDSAPVATIT
jgi:DNA-binding response OmpR family regulator